jgi:hypothetical protein
MRARPSVRVIPHVARARSRVLVEKLGLIADLGRLLRRRPFFTRGAEERPAALQPTKRTSARMAELVKGFNRTEHELALAGEAKATGRQWRTRRKGAACGCWSVALSWSQ